MNLIEYLKKMKNLNNKYYKFNNHIKKYNNYVEMKHLQDKM